MDAVALPTTEISSLATPIALDSYHLPRLGALLHANLVELQHELEGKFLDRGAAEMKYRGRALKRSKLFMVASPTVTADGKPEVLYQYNYPGFQWASMLHYHALRSFPAVERFLRELHAHYTFHGQPLCFNHIIATEYRDGQDNIGWHSDKMQSITPGTPILSLSLGATREFQLRPTPPPKEPSGADSEPVVEPAVVPVVEPTTCMLSHGDVFVLGPETNRLMEHGVPPTAAPTQPRISLVFRHINVEMTRAAILFKVDSARTEKASRQRAKK